MLSLFLKNCSLLGYYLIAIRLPSRAFSSFGVKFRYLLVKTIFKLCGGNVNVAKGVYFGKGNNISIGYNSGIGEGSYFICLDEIIIGDNVKIIESNPISKKKRWKVVNN